MYLENIFSADDIIKQLPEESKEFRIVDKWWREHMNRVQKNPKLIEVCNSDSLLTKFMKNNQNLEKIQKQLENYLETK